MEIEVIKNYLKIDDSMDLLEKINIDIANDTVTTMAKSYEEQLPKKIPEKLNVEGTKIIITLTANINQIGIKQQIIYPEHQ